MIRLDLLPKDKKSVAVLLYFIRSVFCSCPPPQSILTGYPDPEVVWLCGKEPMMESPTVQIEYEEDGRCTLVLAKVGLGDANVYTCRAANDHGEIFCSAKLIVQE